jgi:hypothetical protein
MNASAGVVLPVPRRAMDSLGRGQFRSGVRSDFNIIHRSSRALGHHLRRDELSGLACQNNLVRNHAATELSQLIRARIIPGSGSYAFPRSFEDRDIKGEALA